MIALFPIGVHKMVTVFHRCLLAWLLAWTACAAHANCGVIETLDKLHSVETRLMRNPNSPLFTSDIRYLTNQARQLSGSSITDGIGANPLSDQGSAFLYFIYYAKKLALEVSVDDPATAIRHFQNPEVSENIATVGSYLGEIHCSAAEIESAEDFPVVESDQIDIDLLVARAFVTRAFSMRNVLLTIGLMTALLAVALLRQSKERKQR
jgi:hypothetical protein